MEATRADKLVGTSIMPKYEQKLPKVLQKSSDKAIEIKSRYGTYDKFITTFSMLNVPRFTKDEMRCYTGCAPSLYWISKTYSEEGCLLWIKAILNVLSNKMPSAEKALRTSQSQSISEWLLSSCGWLKASELMLFVNNYGTYCDTPSFSVSELNVKAQMQGFLKRRALKLAEAEIEENNRKALEYRQRIADGHTMNYEQWQEYKRAHLQNETTDDDDRKRT